MVWPIARRCLSPPKTIDPARKRFAGCFSNAKGDVSARMYRGRAHGTRLFDSEYESVSRLILHWLGETFASDDA